jgi:hypothetical protein
MPSYFQPHDIYRVSPLQLNYEFAESTDLTPFTKTQIAGGDGSIIVAEDGVLRIVGAATTDDSGAQFQLTSAPIAFVAGGFAQLATRIFSDTVPEWLVGLCAIDASLIASAPANGIYLHKAANTTAVKLFIYAATVKTLEVTLTTAAFDEKWQDFTLAIAPSTRDNKIGRVSVFSGEDVVYETLETTLPTAALLSPSIAAQSGSAAGTQSVDFDLLIVRATR